MAKNSTSGADGQAVRLFAISLAAEILYYVILYLLGPFGPLSNGESLIPRSLSDNLLFAFGSFFAAPFILSFYNGYRYRSLQVSVFIGTTPAIALIFSLTVAISFFGAEIEALGLLLLSVIFIGEIISLTGYGIGSAITQASLKEEPA